MDLFILILRYDQVFFGNGAVVGFSKPEITIRY